MIIRIRFDSDSVVHFDHRGHLDIRVPEGGGDMECFTLATYAVDTTEKIDRAPSKDNAIVTADNKSGYIDLNC